MEALGQNLVAFQAQNALTQNSANTLQKQTRALETLKTPGSTLSAEKLKDIEASAKDFEAVFISQMMNHMFEGVGVNPVFGGGQGEEMFKGMMVEEYGKIVAEQGGIGIASHVQQQLIALQETQQAR